ncbi:MAG TPA: arylsulfatase [Pyrinomonadaceae bacterium]|nr:arylsulfatase [Pyrinomonadaceae bacterium]
MSTPTTMKLPLICFLWTLILLTQVTGVSLAQNVKQSLKPNIIFIMADDLGYGDLGSYGQKFIKTPHLDRMAREGIRFTQFYAASPVCAPSRASFMTGQHQGNAYIRGNMSLRKERVPLRPRDVTVAEVLKGAGYRTGVIGKWGLGEPNTTGIPNRKGFDYWFGYLNQAHAHNYYPDYLWRNEERITIPKGTYSHDLFTAETQEFIRRERNGPFFLYLAYTIPHANNELGRETGNGMEVPDDEPYSNEKWSQQQKNYAAMVTRMDADIGKILALLKDLNLDQNTLVLFSSDNGPQGVDEGGYDLTLFGSNGPLRGRKRDLYEGGIRVPMIARWPVKIKAGQVSDHLWTQWDFLPTAAAIAGLKPPTGINGFAMLTALTGGKQPNHKHLYFEFHEPSFAQAVRMGRWKAVRRGANGPVELYDLHTDIGETRDLAGKNLKLISQMIEIMNREHVESEHWPVK